MTVESSQVRTELGPTALLFSCNIIKHTSTLLKYPQSMLCNRMSTLECCGMMTHTKIQFRNHVCKTNTRLVIMKPVHTYITKKNKLKTYQYHILTSLSKGTHRSAPQIKLWEGVNLMRTWKNHTPYYSTIKMIKLLCTLLLHHSNIHSHTHVNIQPLTENTRLEGCISNKMIGLKNKNNRHIQTHPQCFLSSIPFSMQCTILQTKMKYVKPKRNHITFNAKDEVLTYNYCYNSMSPKTSSYSSAQRYKDAILAIEGNPEKDLSVTQKRSSNIDVTSSKKKPRESQKPS